MKFHSMHINLLVITVDGDARTSKRARLLVDECEEDYDAEEDLQTIEKDESTFEDLIGNASFVREDGLSYGSEMASWGLLDGHVLARVFHFLRLDMKSLTIASLTCKHWRAAVSFYKDISRQVDLSSLGPKCTDSMIVNIMVRFALFWLCKCWNYIHFLLNLLSFCSCRVVMAKRRLILWF